jgi:cadherin-like protein/FG-GAP repeat protein/fibronectin type III domain protein
MRKEEIMRSKVFWKLVLLVAASMVAIAACGGGGGGGGAEGGAEGGAPGIPQSPSAAPGNGTVTIQWTAVDGATSYNIYWSMTDGVTKANGTKIPNAAPPYSHSSLAAGTAYYYVVTAVNGVGESAESAQVSATTAPPSSNADLLSLTVSEGLLNPVFSPAQTAYNIMFVGQHTATITPTIAAAGATILVNGNTVASGQAAGAIALSPGTNTITVLVTAQDNVTQKTYTISARYLAKQAYIKSSNTGTNNNFAQGVALYGDTLAVSAANEASNATGIGGDQHNENAPNSGAVYVFLRTGATWTQQAYIKSSNTGTNDCFGSSVALYGDTLVVGAYRESSIATGIGGDESNNDAPYSGAVYVFTRDTHNVWTQQAYIKSSNTGTYDFFGYNVAISGDTLAVGAIGEDSNATGVDGDQLNDYASESGAVYVYSRAGTTWTQQAYIKGSNMRGGNYFGNSLALSADTLAVGAYHESSNATGINGDELNNNASYSGAVHVFTRTGTTWTKQAFVKASNTDPDDNFGQSVALSGDTLAVGAVGESSNARGVGGDEANNDAPSSGAVYVFTRTGSTWTQQAYIKSSNTDTNDNFGSTIALSGDTLAVGARGEASNATGINGNELNNDAPGSGAVYVIQ